METNKNYAVNLLRQVDLIDDQIASLKKERDTIYQKLSAYKLKIEESNSHLIGKNAVCTLSRTGEKKPCTCTKVKVLDDYETVVPLFSRGEHKVTVDDYFFED